MSGQVEKDQASKDKNPSKSKGKHTVAEVL